MDLISRSRYSADWHGGRIEMQIFYTLMASQSIPLVPGATMPDDDKGLSILSATAAMTALAALAVCLRMYVRTRVVRSVGMDDYVMLSALALSISGFCIVIPEVQYGAGRHFAYLQPEKASIGLKLNFIMQPIYLWAITVVKLSIAFFFLRIAPFKSYRLFLYGSIVFLIVYTLACFFTIVFQCRPLNILWDGPAVKAVCFTPTILRTLSYVNVSTNIVMDFIFAALPIPLLWHVQMNRQTKIALAGVLGLGVFACVAAVVKASVLGNYGKTGDFLWDSAPLTIWTCVECNTGIIAASIPSMKPLFRTLIEKTLYSSNSLLKKRGYYMRQESGHSLQTFGGKHASDPEKDGPIVTTRSLSHKPTVHDSISDKSIFPLPSSQHITKTTEIRVTLGSAAYDARREGMGWTAGGEAALPERRIEDGV